jgi:hypothetical protein
MASQSRPEIPGSFRFHFDQVNRILLLRLEGRITEETLRQMYIVGERYWTATQPTAVIVDCSSVTQTVSSEHIRGLARTKPMPESIGRLRIIVAPTTVQYGLARMFEIVSVDERPLTVVHTIDEALAILGVKSPDFEPLE